LEQGHAQIKFNDGSIQRISTIPQALKEKYRETFEIDMRWLIKAAAARGKWIDQSQSLNIFFAGTSGKEVSELYVYAWEMGLKTTYYLRTLGASQVEKSTLDAKGTQIRGKIETDAVSRGVAYDKRSSRSRKDRDISIDHKRGECRNGK
jgi:ribonucleotide reductase alpha subunit